jgi:V/A-type H+-transporting ATPase subunit A
MKRTVLIANTSNMPVAAREASVYTGITIAEYYRDMGYSVALQADSTSRWAEAMREISGRLEEMPGEEGYPAYLATRIAEFYERAGKVICLGDPATPGPEAGPARPETQGALTVIGAVSPPGGDLNDPVVQATLRVVKVFWSLEDRLAFRRHFPAISWLNSYSLYSGALAGALGRGASAEFVENAGRAMALLEREAELEEIVRLVGKDTLSAPERLVLEVARSIREDYLHQNAFHETDTYASLPKQAGMLRAILAYDTLARQALQRGADIGYLERVPAREQVARLRYLTEADAPAATAAVESELTEQLSQPSAGPNPAADSTKTNLGPARAEQEAG